MFYNGKIAKTQVVLSCYYTGNPEKRTNTNFYVAVTDTAAACASESISAIKLKVDPFSQGVSADNFAF